MADEGSFELDEADSRGVVEGGDVAGADAEQLRAGAVGVFDDPAMFGEGLQREWRTLAGDDDPKTAFREAYAEYVSDPGAMRIRAPDQYVFLHDHVFFGREFDNHHERDREVAESAAAIEDIEGLSPTAWERLSEAQRTEVLQEEERRLAALEGRPEAPLLVEEMPTGLNGYFDPATGVLHLNRELVANIGDVAKAVDTVAHEGRHAYQHYVVDHPGADPDASEMAAWTVNFGTYLDAGHYGYELYRHQPVEEDAWAFGDGIRDALYARPS